MTLENLAGEFAGTFEAAWIQIMASLQDLLCNGLAVSLLGRVGLQPN